MLVVNYICEGFYRVFMKGEVIRFSFPVTGEIMQLQKKRRKKKKDVTRFGFLDGCQHSRHRKSGSNCLKTEEESHKLIV